MLHAGNPKDSSGKLERIQEFSKVTGHKISIQKSTAFHQGNANQIPGEIHLTPDRTAKISIPRSNKCP